MHHPIGMKTGLRMQARVCAVGWGAASLGTSPTPPGATPPGRAGQVRTGGRLNPAPRPGVSWRRARGAPGRGGRSEWEEKQPIPEAAEGNGKAKRPGRQQLPLPHAGDCSGIAPERSSSAPATRRMSQRFQAQWEARAQQGWGCAGMGTCRDGALSLPGVTSP